MLEDVKKREPSGTVGGNVNWYSHYGEENGTSLKKKKIELLYCSAIPLLGLYLEKTIMWKYTCNVHSITIYNSQEMEAT